MGLRLLLSLSLLLLQTCVPASWGLQCMWCDGDDLNCMVKECAPGENLCSTIIIQEWEGEEHVELTKGCTHAERTNRTMSYRTSNRVISLTETVCSGNLCNRYTSEIQRRGFSRGLECESCTSSDLSCERGRQQILQCRSAAESCIQIVTHEHSDGRLNDERHILGCGVLPGCPGPTGFHNNHTFHYLQCCNSSRCNKGPVLNLSHLSPNGFQCYSCEGNSTHGCSPEKTSLINCRGPMNQCVEATGFDELGNQTYTFRGCSTSSWCEGSQAADSFALVSPNVSCCATSGCNHPTQDAQFRRGDAPRLGPAPLSFTLSLLVVIRLWAGVLLWT